MADRRVLKDFFIKHRFFGGWERRETLAEFAGVGDGMPPVIASMLMAVASNMLEEGLSFFWLFAFVSVCHCVNTFFGDV